MMTIKTIMTLTLLASLMTGLATEAVKNLLEEHGKAYYSNTLAGIVSAVIALAIGVGYAVLFDVTVDASYIICIVCLLFLSWLCAMVGYDKVVQTLAQFGSESGEKDEEALQAERTD